MPPGSTDHDVIIIGAGFAGLYMLHRLRGQGLSARVLEAGGGVGGTWYWNRYPGARCDVESLQYSYSFAEDLQREWTWTERYATQPEILRYLDHVADRFDLRRDIELNTRVTAASWDAPGAWVVETDGGERLSARYLVTAVGCLSAANLPRLPGSFRGPSYHTGRWPAEGVDLAGRRVAVIGTGSSGIQSIPVIAESAEHVTVFQRTPNFSVPARNGPLRPEDDQWFKANHHELRHQLRTSHSGLFTSPNPDSALAVTEEERGREFEARWERGGLAFLGAFSDLMISEEANRTAADFVRGKIRATVRDPAVADLLLPGDHPLGSKRVCVDTGYYAAYNRPDVTLADLRTAPIRELTPGGVRTADREHPVDVIVYATGFDAMTGPLLAIDIRGKGGLSLREKWRAGPRSYLGLMSAGFPNLFTITGPGSPSVLSNMIVSIEQHVDWIAECLDRLGGRALDADPLAEDAWVEQVNEIAGLTLFPRANSWYMGANIPGKPRVFMPFVGGVGVYRDICAEVAANGYQGFLRD
ncbi:NAD(P)/FAD-dependent oxidoreductase [Nonomuraea sp. NPDC049141]|uniref:flavin-containing monooxygenase n=1 Tax=Nonomuraea sp. NPDC049141 TaxID=3155500 RepID=UPI0033D075DF